MKLFILLFIYTIILIINFIFLNSFYYIYFLIKVLLLSLGRSVIIYSLPELKADEFNTRKQNMREIKEDKEIVEFEDTLLVHSCVELKDPDYKLEPLQYIKVNKYLHAFFFVNKNYYY